MINFEKMANFIVDKMASVDVRSQQCAKIRSPLSKCSQCQDICPQKRIKFTKDKVILSDNCLECGLCASVCPTEALSLKEPNIIVLLDKIERIYKNDGVVNISCRRNSSVDEKCITIPCIGALMPELLLVMRLYPFPVHMVYTEEQCRHCDVHTGLDVYNSRMRQVDQLVEQASLSANNIIRADKQVKRQEKMQVSREPQEIDMQKRAFIGSFFGGFKSVPQAVLKNFTGGDDSESGDTKPSITPQSRASDDLSLDRIEILKKYVYEKVQTSANEVRLLQQPRIEGICYFCKACTTLCPTGALEYREGSEILLNTDRCYACNMCVDVCYHKSIQLQSVPLESLIMGKISIAKEHTNVCADCRKEFVASESSVQCAMCQAKERYRKI